MYEKANRICPENCEITHGLATLYYEQAEYEEAQKLLDKALGIHPNNPSLNKLFVKVLYALEKPIEHIVPYIEAYFSNKPQEQFGVPLILRLLIKLFRPKIEWEATIKKFENTLSQLDEWDQWAEGLLKKHKASNKKSTHHNE